MALKIHNTLTKLVDEVCPGGEKKSSIEEYPPITIYSCGPTVYNFAHIGNFRYFVFNDLLRRYLLFRGFKVNQAMNITDVDDKTINGATQEGITLREYTDRYAQAFYEDLETLNIEKVEHNPRATDSIDDMVDIIHHLKEKNLIYDRDESIYFSISKYENYGKLSNVDKREIKSGLRYDTDEYEKDDIRDFALWKGPKENEISWDTPFGKGRPGWHIECSAMIRKIFGTTIDIHTGGVDLIFPHHENEIAQSEAAYDEQFVRHWIHVEHLLVDNTKMSKSKGNFYTLRDLLKMNYSPRAIRYLLLSVYYRKQLNFTFEGLKQAEQSLERIDNLLLRLTDISGEQDNNAALPERIEKLFNEFIGAMDDDLNISKALGAFFEFIHDINNLITENTLSKTDALTIHESLIRLDSVLGCIFFPSDDSDIDTERIESLINERIASKKSKNFARADEIRDLLLNEGIILEDTKDGTRWKKKK